MTALSDKINGLATGSQSTTAPATIAPIRPVTLPAGGSLTEKLNNAASGSAQGPASATIANSNTPPSAPLPDLTGGAYTYDTSGGWQAALHNLAVKSNNITRELADAYTYHGLDALQSLLPGSPSAAQLRAQTAASRADLGPGTAMALDVVGRTANPLSRIGGANPLALATSGAAQEAAAAALHGDNPVGPAIVGGLTGGTLGIASQGIRPGLIPNLFYQVGRPAVKAWGAQHGPLGYGIASAAMDAVKQPGPIGSVAPWVSWAAPGANAATQGIISGFNP